MLGDLLLAYLNTIEFEKKFQSTIILVPGFQQKVRSDYTETPLQSTHDHNGAFNSQDPESSVASG